MLLCNTWILFCSRLANRNVLLFLRWMRAPSCARECPQTTGESSGGHGRRNDRGHILAHWLHG
eukprot:117733-Pyramimonas_sp.AAC.1